MKQQKTWQKNKSALFVIFLFSIFLFFSCSLSNKKPTVLWTNIAECVSYVELFNGKHNQEKVILVYKANPSLALQNLKGEVPPDIVISSFLKTEKTKQLFRSLDNIFNERNISQNMFYQNLIGAGKIKNTLYLLPISFNLPALIFSKENSSFVETDYTLTLRQVKDFATNFNSKNRAGSYTRLGFVPQHNADFLYCATKLFSCNYGETKSQFTWNDENLKKAILFLHDWTQTSNTSSLVEQDFSYKYLSMPDYKQVASGKTLFAYTTSNKFFELSQEQMNSLDYRWLCNEDGIPVEDEIIFAGIPRRAKKVDSAYTFLAWLLNAKTQTEIISLKERNMLNTTRFGIAGGFSSLIEINEHVLPLHKTALLTNIPQHNSITSHENLPANWAEIKSDIIMPYLNQEMKNKEENIALELRIEEWEKQHYN